MAKDLTNSDIDRQNILNNAIVLNEIQKMADIRGILLKAKLRLQKT